MCICVSLCVRGSVSVVIAGCMGASVSSRRCRSTVVAYLCVNVCVRACVCVCVCACVPEGDL